MLALYRSDRQGDALAVAAALRRTLADELGLDPSAAVLELERRILVQDPTLAAPPVEPATAIPPAPALRSEAPRSADVPPRTGVPQHAYVRRAVTSLVGRDEQIAAASTAFQDA